MSAIHSAPVEFTDTELETDPILRYFHYAHLPMPLREISSAFCHLAEFLVMALPRNAERSVALRKLLEAKDAGVRANTGSSFQERTTARQSDKPDEEISGNIHMIGGDRSEDPLPFT